LAKNTLRLFLQNLQQVQPFTLQWVRLFYLHGEGQNPNSLLAALDRAIDASDDSFNMSAGEQLRDYLAIETAAGYLAAIVQQREFDGVINCASGQPVSVRALVEQRLRARGATIQLNLGHYPYPTHEPMAFWGVTDRLQQLLGASHEA
jgi:dTDP-6-deoxy-L-talose 4-dehydrogenase (NAD+)